MKTKTMNKNQAEVMAERIAELQESIALLYITSGIGELEEQVKGLRVALRDYMVESDIRRVEAGPTKYARLIESTQERIWIGTDDEIPMAMKGKRSLKSILSRTMWMKITKRVPDPELILQAVEEGAITTEEITPAYYERMKAPYVRIFNDGQS